MKRFVLMLSIVLTLCGGAPTTRAAWAYRYGGRAWPAGGWGWGPRPAYGIGYGIPAVASYPVYGYYYSYPPYGYPPYGYPYPPPAYPNGQTAYPYQPAQPYGPFAMAPRPGPALTAPLYAYSPTGQQAHSPAVPSMTPVNTAPPAPPDKSKLAEREKRANDELARVRSERDQAWKELSIWTALGVTPEQIRGFQEQLVKLQAQNTFLVRQNSELEFKLSRYIGPEKEVEMPASLSGKILAVDPKYEFVVLNIGVNQGLAKNGKLLVNRGGKLVAKRRLTTVESNSSIANVLRDWKVADVMEGDQVIHQ